MNERTRRTILGGVIPVAVAALGFGPYLAYGAELPDRVATHFSASGAPDASMTQQQLLVVLGVMMVLGLGGCVAIALARRPLRPMVAPAVSFLGAFIGALASGILAITAIDQRGLDRWQDASLAPWTVIPMIGAGLVAGGMAAWVASSLPVRRGTGTEAEPPTMELTPGERAFWSSTLTARWPLIIGLVTLLVALVVLARLAAPWIVLVLLVVTLAVTTFSRIKVTADRSGLRVRYGFLGWPRTSVAIGRIAAARATDIHPAQWGGWGYRGSLALMKRAAVVLRAGPGLRLDLHDGKVFAVTIDYPDLPARLLNAEVSRRGGRRPRP